MSVRFTGAEAIAAGWRRVGGGPGALRCRVCSPPPQHPKDGVPRPEILVQLGRYDHLAPLAGLHQEDHACVKQVTKRIAMGQVPDPLDDGLKT
jgi:hypothetical protein